MSVTSSAVSFGSFTKPAEILFCVTVSLFGNTSFTYFTPSSSTIWSSARGKSESVPLAKVALADWSVGSTFTPSPPSGTCSRIYWFASSE